MKLELEFGHNLCYTPVFKINDIEADYTDFGEKYDRDQGNAQDYGCGDMQFTRIEPRSEVLKKYNISGQEYFEIVDKLEMGLSFGRCGECV